MLNLNLNIVQLGTLSNYLNLFYAYKTRVESDSGIVAADAQTKQLFQMLYPTIDSLEFGWSGVAGSKLRTDGIFKYYTKLYDMQPIVAGDEKITNEADRDFSSDTGWWTLNGSGTSIHDGICTIQDLVSANIVTPSFTLTVGKYYKFSYEIIDNRAGSLALQGFNNDNNFAISSSIGTYSYYLYASSNNVIIKRLSGAVDIDIDNISIVEQLQYPNDATQTTELSQPYQSGVIAPNEFPSLFNPNGDTRHMEHPEISFADGEEYSITTSFTGVGGAKNGIWGSENINFCRLDYGNNLIQIYNGVNDVFFTNSIVQTIGKNAVFTFTKNTSNTVKLYINGVYSSEQTLSTIETSRILRAWALNGYGSISAHIIRSQALTATQVAAEANLLRTIYPEVPSVQIGTKRWTTSNFRAVATCLGKPIANVTENANVEKIVNGGFDTDTDWTKNGSWVIGSGIASNDGSLSGGIYQSGIEIGKWYKYSFDVVRSSGTLTPFIANNQLAVANTSGNYSGYVKCTTLGNNRLCDFYASSFIGSIDNVSIEEVGWSDSQNLYDGLIAQGETEQAALEASAMWCYYNNDSEIGSWAGKLYNWFAVKLLQNDIDAYNLANPTTPWGWHVPSQAEFNALGTYLGGVSTSAGSLMVNNINYWGSTSINTNSSGFSDIGHGQRQDAGTFFGNKAFSNKWTLDKYDVYETNNNTQIYIVDRSTALVRGFALRLIKDN